jgi:NAD(P)-dependent dehydrogenase (short-subunit alcohol dehydrogenase family)
MKSFDGKLAIVTGAGSGMGQEITLQLMREGCSVAMLDMSSARLAETARLCAEAGLAQGVRVTSHVADVTDEALLLRIRDEIVRDHATDAVHLLFNNAGHGGAPSFIADDRAQFERVFNTCWNGVYLCTRVFIPLLMKATEAHLINTSSIHGYWATKGPARPNVAYSAAKFAVKGFTEALITDFAIHAPHIKCSVVMPGHIGTALAINSRMIQNGQESDRMTARAKHVAAGGDPAVPDDYFQARIDAYARSMIEDAPTSAAEAATIILDGVRAGKWRILIGYEAVWMDEQVRRDPESAYDRDVYDAFVREAAWQFGS